MIRKSDQNPFSIFKYLGEFYQILGILLISGSKRGLEAAVKEFV
jgi:hypothetical protein